MLTESGLTIEDGRLKMQQLLSLKEKPDAIYAAGDYAALGALQVLKEQNIQIPEEIALVGFGNEPFTDIVTPSITSVNQHSAEIGKLAAETFLNHVKEKAVHQKLNKQILNADLIIRDSSNKKSLS